MIQKRNTESAATHRTAVAVVEDDAWLSEHLAELLNTCSEFECIACYPSAEDALANMAEIRPDVVLMDIGLPNMNGIECVRHLKSILPEVQVLMLTVYGDAERVFAALQAGGDGYLLKRSSADALFDAIRRVRQGESPMDGQIARKVVQYFNSRGTAAQEFDQLTPREHEVMERLAKGEAYKQIAEALGISIETLRGYVKSVYQKLHVHSRGEAVAKYTGL